MAGLKQHLKDAKLPVPLICTLTTRDHIQAQEESALGSCFDYNLGKPIEYEDFAKMLEVMTNNSNEGCAKVSDSREQRTD